MLWVEILGRQHKIKWTSQHIVIFISRICFSADAAAQINRNVIVKCEFPVFHPNADSVLCG